MVPMLQAIQNQMENQMEGPAGWEAHEIDVVDHLDMDDEYARRNEKLKRQRDFSITEPEKKRQQVGIASWPMPAQGNSNLLASAWLDAQLVGTAHCTRQSRLCHAEAASGGMVTCGRWGRVFPSKRHQLWCMTCAGMPASTMKQHSEPSQGDCAVCINFTWSQLIYSQGASRLQGLTKHFNPKSFSNGHCPVLC